MEPAVEWDFSKRHTVDVVDWPADMMDEDGLAQLSEGLRCVTIHLTADRIVRATVEEIFAAKSGDKIEYIRMHYPETKLEDSVTTAKEIASDFGYGTVVIDEWYQQELAGSGPGTFEHYFHGNEHPVAIGIRPTYDKVNPWYVSIHLYIEMTVPDE